MEAERECTLGDTIVDLIQVQILDIRSQNPVKELRKGLYRSHGGAGTSLHTTLRTSLPGSNHHI
jgi:hypothetical protein